MLGFTGMKKSNLTIAVLSGKGGTGKTLVSVNLAAAAEVAVYLDCDVEEPNGHLFFKPEITSEETVSVKIPRIDYDQCNGCRTCVDFCKFNALAYIKNKPVLFKDVCHSCGGCVLFCPQKAISEEEKKVGVIQNGMSGQVRVHTGCMNAGEASGIPIIKELLKKSAAETALPVFIDCPPGSACIVMESITKKWSICFIKSATRSKEMKTSYSARLLRVRGLRRAEAAQRWRCLPTVPRLEPSAAAP